MSNDCKTKSLIKSILLYTFKIGISLIPSSFKTSIVVDTCKSKYGLEASITCTTKSASKISSNVDLNDSIKWCGKLLTNPTVSVIKNSWLYYDGWKNF